MNPRAALARPRHWRLAAPIRALTFLLALAATAVAAETPEMPYPAARCAALWLGYAAYADRSAYLDDGTRARARGDAFRAVAVRLHDGPAAQVDAFMTEQVPLMALIVEAYIYGADRASRDLFERTAQICADYAATLPELQDAR